MITPAKDRKINGLFVSPAARRIEAQKLYSSFIGIPIKIIFRYSEDISISSAGEPIQVKNVLENTKPIIVQNKPKIRLKMIEVPIHLSERS